MTASERRRAILQVLCERRHETRENLAKEFGVGKRTIENDVLLLSLDFPIYTTRGNGGGIHVEDWYTREHSHLTIEQLALLKRVLATLKGKDVEIMKSIISDFSTARQ